MQSNKEAQRRYVVMIITFVLFVVIWTFGTMRFINKYGADDLKGTWAYDSITMYEFNGRGRGTMHTSVSDYDFIYKLDKDTIAIDFKSDAAYDVEYNYTIKNNELLLHTVNNEYRLVKEAK